MASQHYNTKKETFGKIKRDSNAEEACQGSFEHLNLLHSGLHFLATVPPVRALRSM